MIKKLLLVELNEFDLKYLKYGAKKYNCMNIHRLLSKKSVKTYTKDKNQDYNLDPWVQWVSIHTGKKSNSHKVLRHGETLTKNITQIWDLLSNKKISCSVWGPVNGIFRENKYLKLFFPDPWSFKEKPKPKKLLNFLKLPRYYAMNYTGINKLRLAKYFFIFFIDILFSKSLLNIVSLIPKTTLILSVLVCLACGYFGNDYLSYFLGRK